MEQNKYQHSDKLPLSLVVEELEKDAEFTDKALQILSVEDRGSTHTPMTAVSALINHWLVNRDLNCYIDGKLVDDVTALTVLPVDGDYGAGIEALENWMTIRKDELAALLEQRNLSVTAFLRPCVQLAKDAPQAASADDDVEEQAPDDHDETLAALFDPLPVEALEKMFPANGEWKSWVERAARNGLAVAKVGRALLNPYKAGVWFVRKGVKGWDDAHLYRTLANNLPARSRDNVHLLTGGID